MQVDPVRINKYQKKHPQLMDAVEAGESGFVMRRHPETDYCVKFSEGLCSIQKEKSTEFLGDACHFYPRVTRKFGDAVVMSAALSCPEIARLALLEKGEMFTLYDNSAERLPVEIKDYLPKEISAVDAVNIISRLINMAGDNSVRPERIISRLISIAYSLENISQERWPGAFDVLIKLADSRLLPPEENEMDFYNVIYAFAGLIHASKKKMSERLAQTFSDMEKALGIKMNMNSLEMTKETGTDNIKKIKEQWMISNYNYIMARWIQAQISMSSFPFAGLGSGPVERAIIIAVRFATTKLAILSHHFLNNKEPDNENIIRIIQTISRFMEHLSSSELSISIYKELGWHREARIRALVGDKS